MLSILQKVLDKAHSEHSYVLDSVQYNKPEYWTIDLNGDCEDFALWCREELKKDKINADLVLCLTEQNEGHLVCSVDGWILDNRYSFVMSRDQLKYKWISLGNPDGTWRLITN